MLQDMAVERVKAQKPGDNPVLLIALLNAHWAEKYRPNAVVSEDVAKEVLAEWRKQRKEERAKQREASAVEQAEEILEHRGG
jgi:hypothetical protein